MEKFTSFQMKYFLLFLICLGIESEGIGQTPGFIYIQTEKGVPFYIRTGDSLLSASANGHLILAPINKDRVDIMVGFQGGRQPVQRFEQLPVEKDRGWQLVKKTEGRWVLKDLLDGREFLPVEWRANELVSEGYYKRNDRFAVMLAAVVNDTIILYSRSANETASKNALTRGNGSPEVAPAPNPGQVVEAQRPVPATKEVVPAPYNVTLPAGGNKSGLPTGREGVSRKGGALDTVVGPSVRMVSQYREAGYMKMIFVAREGKQYDTVDVQIRMDSAVVLPPEELMGKDTLRRDKDGAVKDTPMPPMPMPVAKVGKPLDCNGVATDADIDQLRVRMLAKRISYDQKTQMAVKAFGRKCPQTRQLRALSELFIPDEAKFNFFHASFPFVVDKEQFPSLGQLIADPVYVERFRELR
ncbi:hypothetical protein KJS94_00340 [Flavihumibacter rivuli]|uniref:hypothetical protein n=1 Tax=Flavihumibacter rivuli TaxID=2838156 RepID=UPI001BDF6092|nr:hypothetical protein [Flavihumibacter rivuli]ULQ56648.1 hypothetical protein KJS94_00340 [Flavihumibacter rivuli]